MSSRYEEVLVTLVHALLKKLQGHRDLDNEMLENDVGLPNQIVPSNYFVISYYFGSFCG